MAKGPPPKRPANLSPEQMRQAIPRIERRLVELEAFDPDTIEGRDDPRIGTLRNKLETLLESVYPTGTIEQDRYEWRTTKLDTAGYYTSQETPIHEVREGLHKGKEMILHQWRDIIDQFIEEVGHTGPTPAAKALRAYEGLDLQPEIARAASQLYIDGHYANAIEDAVKALNDFVRYRSGVADRDGTALMEHVFSPKNPVLKINPLVDQSDMDEQRVL